MELLDLSVYICSDGTIMSYNADGTLNTLFTDTISYRILKKIYKLSQLENSDRKKNPREIQIKYVKYYFKNTATDMSIQIPSSHVANILGSIR
jgi:hypothetical protein